MTTTASTRNTTRQNFPMPPTQEGLADMATSRTFGDVEVTRIPELTTTFPRSFVFPDTDERLWTTSQEWLAPQFWDPANDHMTVAVQSWLIRSAGQTILVDTGVGNNKDRPGMSMFDHLSTGYLDNLAHAGITPKDIDLVICTHLHPDHVGWNTTRTDNGWIPTFPNARYLLPRADFDYMNPVNAHSPNTAPWRRNAFQDSVTPVHNAGQTELWEGDYYDIDEHLRLEPVPGHTPGSAVLQLRSGTDRAIFVGDLLHSPLQIPHPEHSPCFDEDTDQAARVRTALLEIIADTNTLMVPAHFPGAGAAEVKRHGASFAIKDWGSWS